ncbi:MAG TPA: hypothetical protein VKT32_11685 [Chthonomonadaceae bacterium]|nr:hypothetical protein [Chthonomonadaceae bacterium]
MKKNTALWTAGGLLAGTAVYAAVIRPWFLRWGASEVEEVQYLPGDDLVPAPTDMCTHAITIQAPIEDVWPWLVQIGQDRGGFYSYTWLENLAGCHMRNADQIVPEYQHIQAGDSVRLHPKVPPLPVVHVEPGRALVMGSNLDEPGTWGFFLLRLNENTTRLVVRGQGRRKPGLLRGLFQYLVFDPAHFIMERKMLLTIKRRAEAASRQYETERAA